MLLLVAFAWLGLSLQGMSAFLAADIRDNPGAVPTLVMSLSATIIGSAFLGSVCAHLATGAPWGWIRRIHPLVTGGVTGILAGALAAAVNYAVFSATPTIATIVAGTAGCCALIGALLASRRTRPTVFAGLVATLVLLVLMFLRGWFDNALLNLLTRTPDTYRWVGIAAGVIAGICVGLTAFTVLRRCNPDAKLYTHLGAGALPGLLWLVSEIGVRVAAAMLMGTTQEADELSIFAMRHSLDAQLNGCLAALFAGATTAVLAFGLLLPSDDEDDENDTEPEHATQDTADEDDRTDKGGSADEDGSEPAGEATDETDGTDSTADEDDRTGSVEDSSR